jgi:hypothetical protein
MSANLSLSVGDFFRELRRPHAFKAAAILFASCDLAVLLPLLLGIIWQEFRNR